MLNRVKQRNMYFLFITRMIVMILVKMVIYRCTKLHYTWELS